EYNIVIDIVERTVDAERDGVQTKLTPWEAGMIIGLPSYNVGDLVYARTAEEGSPVAGVEYRKPDDWMLLSVFREHSPTVSEQTRVQGRVFPVITNVSRVYQLDTSDVENEPFDSDSINLNQPWQNVIADVKLSLNVDALNAALTAEQARTSPRASVVNAIEARIAELDTAG
ncbi:hypothetical protein JGH11_16255, partial [Dysgonomonas sp. Marseille-P4677]|nr:hypothetical protein [Dysgonomonas sp. Marseille-P4677]